MTLKTASSHNVSLRRFVSRVKPKQHDQRLGMDLRHPSKDLATVLIFEPDDAPQKKLTGFLKKNGFRVLSTRRPEGVQSRFINWPKPDLLIINAHKQLHVALKIFNAFSWHPSLVNCPVFLIGSSRQEELLTSYAKVDHLRKVILTPFKTELFVRVINSLIRHSQQP